MGRDKTPQVKAILKKALEHINSLEYRTSLRWCFYRVWQDGILQKNWKKGIKRDMKTKQPIRFEETESAYKKRCYVNFTAITSSARHQLYGGWKRDSLADDTRNMIIKGIGEFNRDEWINELSCYLDKFQTQDYVLLIMFEAQAMIGQFQHLTKHIPLIPSSGEFTIDYKNSIALAIEELDKRYHKPIVVLYFGDCDDKGREIRTTAMKDIRNWCRVGFEDFYCGLNEEQSKQFNLPSNPEKPNQYQWESLTDEQAKQIILPYIEKHQNLKRIEKIEKKEKIILKWAKNKLKGYGK